MGSQDEGDETLLLVEDELSVRTLATRALEMHGYQVLSAANAAEARALAREHAASIDMLVSDVVMPGDSGAILARELRSRGVVGRVLLISGYAFEHVDPEMLPDTHFLAKPFTPRELAARVREVLDGG